MTRASVARTDSPESAEAGRQLGRKLLDGLDGASPDAAIVFASSRYQYEELLRAFDDACHPGVLVGCSSAGEFVSEGRGEGSACALALVAPEMRFSVGVGRGLSHRLPTDVAADLVAGFQGLDQHDYVHHTALVLTDPLAGHAEALVEQLTLATAGTYRFFGGGAGDDAAFRQTYVFTGTEAVTDAAVALEILSNRPLGIGVAHGWRPASARMRVTEANGMVLSSLNAYPAVEAFREHASASNQRFPEDEPLPFFLQNVLGVESPDGYRLRVPLGVSAEGGVTCAAEVAPGASVAIMNATGQSTKEAVAAATRSALEQLEGGRPEVALFFDCVATRLRLGQEFDEALAAVKQTLGTVPYAGCNTYGQIARAEGQFSGFHNCTAVVCVIPS